MINSADWSTLHKAAICPILGRIWRGLHTSSHPGRGFVCVSS